MNLLQKIFKNGFLAIFSLFISGLLLLGFILFYFYLELPDVSTLKNMQLQVPLRVFTGDGKLIAEYGEDHRIPVTLSEVPERLIQGVLATEDQRYFEHPGVDMIGLVRAARELVVTGRKSQGASTITMQVARNFFLSRQKTFGRKLNEILLALKIDSNLSKEKVLELYLNRIYLGKRAYGVAAAAEVYFGKSLNELNLSEMALLAGLPQAPSRDNPIDNPHAALERRNHVLERMLSSGYISENEYQKAIATPLSARLHNRENVVEAPYVGEMVRAAMVEAYGDAAYTNGLKVFTTIDSRLQVAANEALKKGLINYDSRHGYRGPEKHIRESSQWRVKLAALPTINGMVPAVITHTSHGLTAVLANHTKISVDASYFSSQHHFKKGDIIRVIQKNDHWVLTQIPKAEAAIVSLDPNTGQILALTGGFSFNQSLYNRATQAKRQPGSSFKPFVYSAALEKNFTLASIVNDAPIEQYISGSNTIWRPQNSDLKFYGPTHLRFALVHSRNTVSIRVLEAIGIPYTINYATRFGFDQEDMPRNLTLALGTNSVTPMQLASGFATFANGGYRIKPYFINRITDDNDKLLYQADPPSLERTITPENAYLMNSVLQDVIRQGTGHKAMALNRRDIAGKTGTTSDQMDGWFVGYNGDIVTTVWVGFDQRQSLAEYGADAALPIWIDYMRVALNGKLEHTLIQPPNIIHLPINLRTGYLTDERDPNSFYELFDKNHLPTEAPAFPFKDPNNSESAAGSLPPPSQELATPNVNNNVGNHEDSSLELDKPTLKGQDLSPTENNQENGGGNPAEDRAEEIF
jgi:penicillin-binding protein 1A